MKAKDNHGLIRIDDNLLRLENEEQIDVRVFANKQVPMVFSGERLRPHRFRFALRCTTQHGLAV